jgi:alkanesulfonate monooxygenase SsuD/methylene tetrahydromethanopterin reductase-like flavin-dependent oxidoreductase (luciferase family)
MFHFGWFVGKGYSVHGWNQPWTGAVASDWMEPDIYMDLARALERACFDCLIIEDGSFIADAYQDSPEWYLRNAFAVPKSDPMPLVPLLGYVTKNLGLVATVTTSFYPPYLAARLGATLDHLTHGRVGLNVVTAHNDRSAQNYGLERHYEHDLRYVMADEWMDVVNRLWESWEPDQGPPDQLRGPLLQVARAAEYRAGTATAAGHLPGGRLAGRPGVRRETCRPDYRQGPHRRGSKELPPGHLAADGVTWARTERLQGDVQHLGRHW